MWIYVFRLPDGRYSAGLDELACAVRGKIVERWPVRTLEEARFVARHGTAFSGASEKVTKLADVAIELLMEHPEVVQRKETKHSATELDFWKRLQLAFYILFRIQRVD